MDDTLRELQRFRRAHEDFVEALKASDRELLAIEERMHAYWEDEFEKEFHSRYRVLADPVRKFIRRDSSNISEFLAGKEQALRRYLGRA